MARVLALALVALELLYLLAANLFLNFWFGALFQSTNSINTTLGSAYTLWPGTVHVRDVRIVFQDHNLQWSLDIASASVVLHLSPLARQTFHAKSVVGDGAVFRMRHRIDPWDAGARSVSALAPIPEFPSPAVFEARVPEAPVTEENYNLWTVHLENVDVGVREAWVQQFRYVGGGRARGQFRLRPARTLWVGPATLDLDGGELTAGSYRVSRALSGRVDCIVHPFDVRKPEGRAVFRYISAGFALRAPGLSLAAARLFQDGDDPLLFGARDGELVLAARLDRGVFTPGSRLELRQHGLTVTHARFDAEAVRAELVARADSGGGSAALELDDAKLRLPGTEASPPSATLRAVATSSSVDTTADWRMTGTELERARVTVPDARWFDPFTRRAALRMLAGSAVVEARGSYRDGKLRGDAHGEFEKLALGSGEARVSAGKGRVDLELATEPRQTARLSGSATAVTSSVPPAKLRLESDELRWSSSAVERSNGSIDAVLDASARRLTGAVGELGFRATPELHVDVTAYDRVRSRGRLQATLGVSAFSASEASGDPDCPWSKVERAELRGTAELRGEDAVHYDLVGLLRKAEITWGDFRAALGNAELRSRFDGRALDEQKGQVDVKLAVRNASLRSGSAPHGWQAKLPSLDLGTKLVRQRGTLGGPIRVSVPGVAARIGRTPFRADLAADVGFAQLDLDKAHAVGAGTLRVRNLDLALRDERIEKWWADVELGFVDVWAKETLNGVASFRAKLRDGLPALSVLAAQGELPGFVPDVFPLRDLEAEGTVSRHCKLTSFRVARVSGGPFTARGQLESVPEAVRGAFVVRLSPANPLSAGIHFDGDESGVSLFAGQDWLAERTDALERHAKQVENSVCVPPPRECESK